MHSSDLGAHREWKSDLKEFSSQTRFSDVFDMKYTMHQFYVHTELITHKPPMCSTDSRHRRCWYDLYSSYDSMPARFAFAKRTTVGAINPSTTNCVLPFGLRNLGLSYLHLATFKPLYFVPANSSRSDPYNLPTFDRLFMRFFCGKLRVRNTILNIVT